MVGYIIKHATFLKWIKNDNIPVVLAVFGCVLNLVVSGLSVESAVYGAAIWGVYKIIKEVKKPSEDLRKEVEKHSKLLDTDDRRLKEIEDSNKMILQTLLAMINHNITGNGIENMKKIRDDLQKYLVDK